MKAREEVIGYFGKTYRQEYDALGSAGVDAILARGREWKLSPVLSGGGALVFPHVHIADCGHYVAAVVHACLDSGADRILAIGVLHASSDEMEAAKTRIVTNQTQPEEEPLRAIYGTGLTHTMDAWKRDHGLYGFRRLLADAADRRGIKPPDLIERYPYLTGPRPESLPGIAELSSIANDAVVVSTADHCHHGIGYGESPQEALYYDETGLAQIRQRIESGLALLDDRKYADYIQHCITIAKSDWRDAGPVVHHLQGPLHSTVLNIVPSDFSNSIYQSLAPTWAAGALVKAERS